MAAINLQKFCARKSDLREYLCAPWHHAGFTYATNGHVLVRIAAPEHADAVADHPLAIKAQALIDEKRRTEGHAPLPPFEQGAPCFECEGMGQFKQAECEDCDGEGTFIRGRFDYECKGCEGHGLLPDDSGELMDCPCCHGWGRESKFIRIGPIEYQARYLALIRNIEGVTLATGTETDAAHFVFEGGEGLLMPIRSAA